MCCRRSEVSWPAWISEWPPRSRRRDLHEPGRRRMSGIPRARRAGTRSSAARLRMMYSAFSALSPGGPRRWRPATGRASRRSRKPEADFAGDAAAVAADVDHPPRVVPRLDRASGGRRGPAYPRGRSRLTMIRARVGLEDLVIRCVARRIASSTSCSVSPCTFSGGAAAAAECCRHAPGAGTRASEDRPAWEAC